MYAKKSMKNGEKQEENKMRETSCYKKSESRIETWI